MKHIVIVGGGIGGVSMAYDMRALCKKDKDIKITLISDKPTFHFVPSNPWVGVNWRKRSDIELPLSGYMNRKGIDFVCSAVKKLDPASNTLLLADGQSIPYDYLVIATGPHLAFENVPGLGPDGFTQSVCHVDHAEIAGQKWSDFKKKPGPIVVGTAPGVSCFGPAYEHAFIMDRDLAKAKIRHKVPMTFVTAEPYIGHLGLGGVGDSKGLLESKMRERDIKWICNARIDKIEQGQMSVSELDENGTVKKEHTLPFSYSMIIPPFAGVEFLRGIDGLVNEKGFVLIDEFQRNPNYKNIYAVGVCVAIPPAEKTPVPTGMPKTGYMIESMVAATAHNIHGHIHGAEPSAQATWNAICLADMGNTGAAFVAIPQIPPRNVAWMRTGMWVHWLKILFEWYFLRKVRTGSISPLYEKYGLRFLGIRKRQIEDFS